MQYNPSLVFLKHICIHHCLVSQSKFYRECWWKSNALGFNSELFVILSVPSIIWVKVHDLTKVRELLFVHSCTSSEHYTNIYMTLYDSCNLPLSLCTCTSFLISAVLGANSPLTTRPHIFCEGTHPETNSQENGWKWKMKLGWPIFRGICC